MLNGAHSHTRLRLLLIVSTLKIYQLSSVIWPRTTHYPWGKTHGICDSDHMAAEDCIVPFSDDITGSWGQDLDVEVTQHLVWLALTLVLHPWQLSFASLYYCSTQSLHQRPIIRPLYRPIRSYSSSRCSLLISRLAMYLRPKPVWS